MQAHDPKRPTPCGESRNIHGIHHKRQETRSDLPGEAKKPLEPIAGTSTAKYRDRPSTMQSHDSKRSTPCRESRNIHGIHHKRQETRSDLPGEAKKPLEPIAGTSTAKYRDRTSELQSHAPNRC